VNNGLDKSKVIRAIPIDGALADFEAVDGCWVLV
jgi:hypothetical protein